MPENTFRFKQFAIKQDKTAMKVGTDGVLIGAWCDVAGAKTILDVGSGTGLIALMLAQRTDETMITAIDIEEGAYHQAKENVANSKWKNRISFFHSSLQAFAENHIEKFDLIVSNPPYFSNAFKPDKEARAKARHTDTLSFKDFFYNSATFLSNKGRISLIVPADIATDIKTEASKNKLFLKRFCKIYPNSRKPAKRFMMEFVKQDLEIQEIVKEELTIETAVRHHYTKEYIDLTKDFYLKF